MALASGLRMYTPPKSVVGFERRNMFLPAIYASEGDAILMLHEPEKHALREISERRPDLRLLRLPDLKGLEEPLSPWGWDLSLRTMLARAGYPETLLPSEEALGCWRMLAHRRNAIMVREYSGEDEFMWPKEFSDRFGAKEFMIAFGRVLLKMPWSSSGRGVLVVTKENYEQGLRRIRECIARQRSIVIEPMYDNACDFATEWESDGREVYFKGFSMFETDSQGRYKGNVAAPQDVILDHLAKYTHVAKLKGVPKLLRPLLKTIFLQRSEMPYVGPFGVDGLIDTHRKIVPCIEVNLRRTMGHVALDAYASGYENPFLCVQ